MIVAPDHRDRRARCSCIPTRAAARRPRIDVRGRGADRDRVVQLDLRAQRGHDLRLVEADQGPHGRRARRVAGDARDLDHPVRVRARGRRLHARSSWSSGRWSARDRDPLFEFGQLRHLGLPLRPAHDDGARDGPVRAAVHPPRAPAERRALLGVARRRMDGPAGHPHRDRRADRRPADAHVSITSIVRIGSRARGDRAAAGRARDLARRLVPRAAPGHGAVRPRRRLRELAADQRDPLRHRPRQGGRRERRPTRPCARSASRSASRRSRRSSTRRPRTSGSPTAVANGARPAMFFAAGVVGVRRGAVVPHPARHGRAQLGSRGGRRRVRVDRHRPGGDRSRSTEPRAGRAATSGRC